MNILVPSLNSADEERFFEKADIETVRTKYGKDIADLIINEEKLREIFGPCMVSKFYDFLHMTDSRPDIEKRFFSNNDQCEKTDDPVTFIFHTNGVSKDKLLLAVNKGIQITKTTGDLKFHVRSHSFQTAPLVIDRKKYLIDKDKINRYENVELFSDGKEKQGLAIRVVPKKNVSYPVISHYAKGDDNIDRAHKHIYDLRERLRSERQVERKVIQTQVFSIEELAFCAGIMYRLVDKGY